MLVSPIETRTSSPVDPTDGQSEAPRRRLPTLPAGALEHGAIGAASTFPRPEADVILGQETQRLGLTMIGVTSLASLTPDGDRLRGWLRQGYQAEMAYLEADGRHRPERLLECARSVVAVALPYGDSVASRPASAGAQGRIARYALGHDYHTVLRSRLRLLADRLATQLQASVIARACVDSAPLLERALAERAGIGFIGKNTMLIIPGTGSWTVLGELLLDIELTELLPNAKLPRKAPSYSSSRMPHDEGMQDAPNPTWAEKTSARVATRCGRCTACLDRCPTRAFASPYALDARRCISYLTIEHTGAIPRALRPQIGDWVFGCDVCQEVCPFNRGPGAQESDPELGVSAARHYIDLASLLELGSAQYKRLTRGTALNRVSRNQLARNAAVALGNSADPEAVPVLRRALCLHPSAIVRGHAAWALSQLDATSALADLERSRREDPDNEVREECEQALVRLEST